MPLHGRHLLLPGCQHLVKGVPADGSSVGAEGNVSEKDNGICEQIAALIWYLMLDMVHVIRADLKFQGDCNTGF